MPDLTIHSNEELEVFLSDENQIIVKAGEITFTMTPIAAVQFAAAMDMFARTGFTYNLIRERSKNV